MIALFALLLGMQAPQTPALVTVERIAKFAPAAASEWHAYLTRSRAMHDRDSIAMAVELRAAQRSKMTQAPYAHDFALVDSMPERWFASDSAQRIADIIVSFQAPNGGWSKHVDLRKHVRQPAESYFGESDKWEWISTIDNRSTTEQIRFLIRANQARRDKRYEDAIGRGVLYLMASQYPNGCFPQVYPLEGGYHDAATFNDDATVNVLRLFGEILARNDAYIRSLGLASAALAKGTNCILESQISVNGTLTAWGQQHDPLTLEPIAGRSYELKSLSAMESAAIVDYLMTIPSPSTKIVRAVDAAVAWFQSTSIRDYTYKNYELKKSPGAGPLWGRLYEIGTNRVIMANRDGVKLYDWSKLTDRRTGYGWYGDAPAKTIAAYEKWKRSSK